MVEDWGSVFAGPVKYGPRLYGIIYVNAMMMSNVAFSVLRYAQKRASNALAEPTNCPSLSIA